MKIVDGYERGERFDLRVVECEGVWMEVDTAICFLRMQRAAHEQGIRLTPTSGFRMMKHQRKLYNERRDPDVRRIKGGAAKPGWSRHQNGLAIDIKTGLTRSAFLSGARTPIYDWLEEHAEVFGFARTVKSEPWHWERVVTPDRIDLKHLEAPDD